MTGCSLLLLQLGRDLAALIVQDLDLHRIDLIREILHVLDQTVVASLGSVTGLVDGERLGHEHILLDARAEPALSAPRSSLSALDAPAIVTVSDASGTITHVNDRFCQISQYSRAELVGQTHRIVTSGAHSSQFWAEMWRHIAGGSSWRGEVCNRARDGSLHWVDATVVPVLDEHGAVLEHVAIRTEITQRKQLEEQLRSAALTDGLTQLPNRVSMLERLHGAVLRARRSLPP